MFSKVTIPYNFLALSVTIFLISCSRPAIDDYFSPVIRFYPELRNSVSVRGQKLPPENIQTIQFYRERVGNAPIIGLNTDETLTLKFDELGFEDRMFRVRFTHHNADWSESPLLPNFFLRGFSEDYITNSQPSHTQRPAYTHYTYIFPNENVELLVSGNYMIEVYEYESGEILFSLPFFVQENKGRTEIKIEEFFGPDSPFLAHQPFATYLYPDEVMTPQTEIEIQFVQNHFWGRARSADVTDISEIGRIRKYITRENAYVGRFEFRRLDLRRLRQTAFNILEYRPETIPPQVILYRDVVNLDINPAISQSHIFGTQVNDIEGQYTEVHFELEIPKNERTDAPVYIIGPFNNWTIHENNRMTYNEDTDSYSGTAIVKQGLYDYKYAIVEDGTVNDIRLDASFAVSRQIYHTMVYFSDPQHQADRLLNVQTIETK